MLFGDFGRNRPTQLPGVRCYLLFLAVRSLFVPRSFGQYGHYRGSALAEIAAKPGLFAGHGACESCHTDAFEVKSKGVRTRCL